MDLGVVIKHYEAKKKQGLNADNNNTPFENDRYPDLSNALTEEFRPNIDICITYFGSHLQGMNFN